MKGSYLWSAVPRILRSSQKPRPKTNGTANRDHKKLMLFNHNNIVLALKLRVESISEVYQVPRLARELVSNERISLALPSGVMLA